MGYSTVLTPVSSPCKVQASGHIPPLPPLRVSRPAEPSPTWGAPISALQEYLHEDRRARRTAMEQLKQGIHEVEVAADAFKLKAKV